MKILFSSGLFRTLEGANKVEWLLDQSRNLSQAYVQRLAKALAIRCRVIGLIHRIFLSVAQKMKQQAFIQIQVTDEQSQCCPNVTQMSFFNEKSFLQK
jgi:hypothetical protein